MLRQCIKALLDQTRPPDMIIVADNASTDGTEAMLNDNFPENPDIEYCNLGGNLGGGGGFHHGSCLAVDQGYDWIWLMDDDCFPDVNCLEKLIGGVESINHVYSPIILSSEDRKTVLWGIKAFCNTGNVEVATLPFNGFFVHRKSLQEIGVPDKNFFIYGDDTEFNMRARAYGKKIILVTDSAMYHPHKNQLRGMKVYKMFLNKLWTYYKLRNAIIIYKKYGYVSANQVIMFVAAAGFYVLTFNYAFLGLWLQGLKDGINGRLYVKDSL
jgi:GT2 family glycosyltransferase